MKREWIKMVHQITKDSDGKCYILCPNCGEYGIDYIYVGDEETRIGFLQIWCSKCLKGIYISRAVAPANAKFVSFDTDLKNLVPEYDIIDN